MRRLLPELRSRLLVVYLAPQQLASKGELCNKCSEQGKEEEDFFISTFDSLFVVSTDVQCLAFSKDIGCALFF